MLHLFFDQSLRPKFGSLSRLVRFAVCPENMTLTISGTVPSYCLKQQAEDLLRPLASECYRLDIRNLLFVSSS
jgi:hypothetical protein